MKYTLLFALPVWLLASFGFITACQSQPSNQTVSNTKEGTSENPPTGGHVTKNNAEWKKILTPNQYAILREHGTERAFTSPLNDIHDHGIFYCAACHTPLFSSDTKFDSGTGWPSFYAPLTKNAVRDITDKSYGMVRTEVVCNVCGGHLGHVFDDGPKPTGLRYCMNGVAMTFEKKK